MSESATPAVEVRGLSKNYGRVAALRSVDLSIAAGEYFVLLGPSGGGKTTLLRLLGGFLKPSAGSVRLAGRDVSGLPPNRRPTGMVFQSYALFPHMTVAGNVGYGLKLKKLPPEEIDRQVQAALAQVSLQGYDERRPRELSGGQQQRVQLARALVLQPQILLLDEPLAALDAKLRKDMCYELKTLQESVGITFVHVTHNQEEALTVADRIAIIADGRLVEHGTTRAVYERPRRRFTAEFIGENNVFDGKVIAAGDGRVRADLGFTEVSLHADRNAPVPAPLTPGDPVSVSVSVRSECMRLGAESPASADAVSVPVRYREQVYLGLTVQHVVVLNDGRAVSVRALADADDNQIFRRDDELWLSWSTDDCRLHLD